MRIFVVLIAIFISPVIVQASDLELPSGWRLLKLSNLKKTADYAFRSQENDLLSVEVDFDGDGIKDVARFLAKNDGSEFALFLTTHFSNGVVHHKQYSTAKLQEIARLGISLAEPGEYDTACGKGYWACGSKEPPKLTLQNPGVSFFTFESGSSLIYWDSKQQKFEEIAISD